LLGFGINYILTCEYLKIQPNTITINDSPFRDRVLNIAVDHLDDRRLILFRNSNYFLLDKKTIEETVKKEIPEISSITIKKKFSKNLEIEIIER